MNMRKHGEFNDVEKFSSTWTVHEIKKQDIKKK